MQIIKGYTDGSIRALGAPDAVKYVMKKNALMIIGGEFAITKDVDLLPIATMLGSCVAVVLYDEEAKIKGMNHFLLPEALRSEMSYRYGINAMEMMMNEMYKLGCKKKNLIAKIAGGATMIRGFSDRIGERNVEFAQIFCKKEGIPVRSEHVLGDRGRVIMVDCGCNTMVRTFKNPMSHEQIVTQEKATEKDMSKKIESCELYTLWSG